MSAVRTATRPAGSRVRVDVPLALVGPTASGKTEASILLARRLGAEVLLIDSMTVYRGMDVGTAKPAPEERAGVPHHLVDVTDPAQRRALQAEAVALGASALHRRLAWLDPAAAAAIEPSNVRRVVRALEVAALTGRPFSSFARAWGRYPGDHVRGAGVTMAPDILRARIEARVRRQLEEGLVEEVRSLVDRGIGSFVTASQAIGYVEVAEYLEGRLSLDEAMDRTVRRTRALARRQMAWFRRDPRIRWIEAGPEGAAALVEQIEEHYLA